MGEYVRLTANGKSYPFKLGVCEDLFYVRFEEFADLVTAGQVRQEPGNEPPTEYLQGGFRFRFPFPDEDGQDLHNLPNNDRGFLVQVPMSLALDMEHEKKTTWTALLHGYRPASHGTPRLLVTCPNTSDGTDIWAKTDLPGWLAITQQRPHKGALWTVVDCPYCGNKTRLNPISGHGLAAAIENVYPELARRIVAGYAPGNPVEAITALGWIKEGVEQ